jgi:hypothetical protein
MEDKVMEIKPALRKETTFASLWGKEHVELFGGYEYRADTQEGLMVNVALGKWAFMPRRVFTWDGFYGYMSHGSRKG